MFESIDCAYRPSSGRLTRCLVMCVPMNLRPPLRCCSGTRYRLPDNSMGNDHDRTLPALIDPSRQLSIAPELVEAAKEYASNARSAATKRAYESQWKGFIAWCAENGRTALPADSVTVVAYLTARAKNGTSASTLSQGIVAIREAHRLAGAAEPVDRHVQEVWKGIRRKIGTASAPSDPLTIDLLRPILAAMPGTLRGIRDGAMLAIGFHGAFRRSELVGLDVEDLKWSNKGLVIKIRRSKTDQEGKGQTVGIPTGDAIERLTTWLKRASIDKGAIFRTVDQWNHIRGRLDGRDVARAVKNAVARIGGDAPEFSGHSLRSGLATSAAAAGKHLHAIKRQGRWKSSQTLDRYIREADLFSDNASEGLEPK